MQRWRDRRGMSIKFGIGDMLLIISIAAVWIIMISEYLSSQGNFAIVKEFTVNEIPLSFDLQHLVADRWLFDFAWFFLTLAIL
jgi:hypothetical protein